MDAAPPMKKQWMQDFKHSKMHMEGSSPSSVIDFIRSTREVRRPLDSSVRRPAARKLSARFARISSGRPWTSDRGTFSQSGFATNASTTLLNACGFAMFMLCEAFGMTTLLEPLRHDANASCMTP
jgi:hypothetical protein